VKLADEAMYNAKLQGKDRISKAWQLQSPAL